MKQLPAEGQIVFVHGGVAQYRGGVFYTGMEDPRYVRPIRWDVKWWCAIDGSPAQDTARRCAQIAGELEENDGTAASVREAIRIEFGLAEAERGGAK